MLIEVSVIIPTLGKRLSNLSACLGSLVNQSYKDFEVLIVNDGGNGLTLSELVEKYENNMRIRVVHRRNRGGIALARNTGLRVAEGEIVAITDDDCIVSRNWVENIVKSYIDPRVGGVGGPVYSPGEKCIPTSLRVTWYGELAVDKSSVQKPVEVGWIRGCNSSYRKDVLSKIGGYDANFGLRSSCEDMDVSFAIRKLGYRLIFNPKASVIHYDLPVGGWKPLKASRIDHPRWHYWRARNHMYLAYKHMNYLGGTKCILGVAGYSILKCFRYSRAKRLPSQQIPMSIMFSILGSLDGMMCGILQQPIRFYGI